MSIIEIEAREILEKYEGLNNQILLWKQKMLTSKSFKLTRTQADYIKKYKNEIPKVARKKVTIVSSFAEKLKEDNGLTLIPEQIWVEKILCSSDKAYHIWGKLTETQVLHAFWIPKAAIIPDEKKLNRVIDYSKYDVVVNDEPRSVLEHQKPAIEKLLVNNRFILADDMGLCKALVINTLIYTPGGTTQIGDIKIGDKVIGSDGRPCNVTGVFPQGNKNIYQITFNDGYKIKCCGDHLWKVLSANFGKNRNNERQEKEIILTTEQLLDENLIIEHSGNGHNKNKSYKFSTFYKQKNGNLKWQIPIVQPIQFENKNILPIEPYLLGISLGDGHFENKNVIFSIHRDDFNELFTDINIYELSPKQNCRVGKIILGESISKLGLSNTRSHNKFIPNIYKYSSIENRLSLLQGLMDTDGTCPIGKNHNFNGAIYTTVSERLADDVVELVQTLGGIARKSSRKGYYIKNGEKINCKLAYLINIKLPEGMNPFKLKRKADLYHTPLKYKIGRYIKNIERCGKDEAVCIRVDAEDHLFVANHCIVTHNTGSSIIAALESNAKKILVVCPASLKINWKREIEIYSDKKIFIVDGKKWVPGYDIYIVNYDIIKNFHTTDKSEDSDDYKLIMNEEFNLAIVDEAHKLSNTDAIRTQLLNDILEKIPKVWLLTGTPMTSRPINYFNLLKIMHSPLTLNWASYVKRYCKGYQFKPKNSPRKVWNTSGAANLDELRERTKHLVLRRLKSEVSNLPDKFLSPVFLELNSTFYNDELEDLMRIAKDHKTDETLSVGIQSLVKIRQIIAREKIKYTCEIIDKYLEENKKVVVFTNFTATLNELHEIYKKNSVTLDGKMSKSKRQESIDRFQNEDKTKVFIGNLEAAGVGITLTAGEIVIMNDLCFVPSSHLQGEDRCVFEGQKIMTKNGYINIENVNVGDYVYTHHGNFKKVINKQSHLEIKKIKTDINALGYNEHLSLTHDHKVFVYNKNENFHWKECGILDINNDYLTVKKKSIPDKIKKHIKIKNYINNNFQNNHNVTQSNGRLIKLKSKVELTDELLYAFGFYIAEGWSTIDNNKSATVNVCQKINNDKMNDAAKYIINIFCESFGINKHSEYVDKNGVKTCTIYSKNLALNFINWFGDNSRNKKLPKWCDKLNKKQLIQLLNGFNHGDGYKRGNTQESITTSNQLAYQLFNIYNSLNKPASLSYIKNNDYYVVKYIESNNKKILIKDGYILYPIKSITKSKPKRGFERVYDLSVEDDQSFVVGSYNVHNCYRTGQKKNVTVYYPVFENTIELIIYNILNRKKKNINQVMGDENEEEAFSRELLGILSSE
jgi:hypothetical protein